MSSMAKGRRYEEGVTSPRALAPLGIKIRIKGSRLPRSNRLEYVSHHDSNTALKAVPLVFSRRGVLLLCHRCSVLIALANLAVGDQTGNSGPDNLIHEAVSS